MACSELPAHKASERTARRGDTLHEIETRARAVGALRTPRECGWSLEPLGLREVQEVAVVLSLSVHSTFVAVKEFARGAQEHVETPLLFAVRDAQIAGSQWAVIAHNHPSGSAEPSRADVQLWHQAREQFRCSGLTLLDHLVIGKGEFYSCAWNAYWRVK